MLFRQLFDAESFTYTYLIASRPGREALIIDSVHEQTDKYLRLLEELDLKLVKVVDTHTHADHITACFTLSKDRGIPFYMWKDTASLGVTDYIDEDSSITIAGVEYTFLHVPGHTQDSVIISIDGHIFTGDFLFNGDAVRIDRKMNSNIRTGLQHTEGTIPTCVWEKNNHTTSKDYIGWHATTKNIDILSRIIKAYTNVNDVVLDCFMGSGSTAVASIRTGRNFIGCERDKEYYTKAKKRICDSQKTDTKLVSRASLASIL